MSAIPQNCLKLPLQTEANRLEESGLNVGKPNSILDKDLLHRMIRLVGNKLTSDQM